MKKIWHTLLFLLLLINLLIWYSVFSYSQEKLKIIACDVGQGDAFLVTFKDFQILIDGGPDSKVLNCLSDNMPFWDREIEVVILSHPQKDHFGGLIKVFENYKVGYFLTTPLDSGSVEWRVLKDLVGGSHTEVINPRSGDKYRCSLIYLDILYPADTALSQDSAGYMADDGRGVMGAYTSDKDPNEFSLVLLLSFKDFDALFTGDINPGISDKIAQRLALSDSRRVEYIKVPHHGSKNGLTDSLLTVVNPEIAVISSGKNNSYGHPHKEIIDLLTDYKVRILRTDESGNIIIESDGMSFWIVK